MTYQCIRGAIHCSRWQSRSVSVTSKILKTSFPCVIAIFLITQTLTVEHAYAGDVDCGPGVSAVTCRTADGSDDIVDGTVDAADLGTDSVESDEVAAGQISGGNGTKDHIENGSINADDLGTDSVTSDEIENNSIRSVDIRDETIRTQDIRDGEVTEDDLADDSVTRDKLHQNTAGRGLVQQNNGALRVNAGDGIEVINDEVVADVDDNTIEVGPDGLQVKDEGINSAKIEDDSIRSRDIKDETIRSRDIKDDTIMSSDIKDDTIRSRDIKDETIRSRDIKDNTIMSSDIKDDTIRSRDIKDETIRSRDIKDGTVAFVDLAPEVVNKINSNMMATQRNREDIDKNTEGIALAMAIANAPVILDGDKTFSLSIGLGFFDDATAGAFKGALKLAPNAILTGSVAVTDDEVGGGVGVGFGF